MSGVLPFFVVSDCNCPIDVDKVAKMGHGRFRVDGMPVYSGQDGRSRARNTPEKGQAFDTLGPSPCQDSKFYDTLSIHRDTGLQNVTCKKTKG